MAALPNIGWRTGAGATAAGTNATLSRSRTDGVPAHGGKLVSRVVLHDEAADVLLRAASLPRVVLDRRAAADAELIATGALSPLDGFLRRDDYVSVIRDMRLASGVLFPIPVTLSVPRARRSDCKEGREVALADATGTLVGVLLVDELYDVDRELALGGRLTLARRTIERTFPEHHRDPSELRALIASKGWRRTAAFLPRAPIRGGDEHVLRAALELVDGVVVHPFVDDANDDVRMRGYEVMLESYFPAERVLLSVFPFATRHGGAREALMRAIALQNYGFSHVLVDRDHTADYGSELAIAPLFVEHETLTRRAREN